MVLQMRGLGGGVIKKLMNKDESAKLHAKKCKASIASNSILEGDEELPAVPQSLQNLDVEIRDYIRSLTTQYGQPEVVERALHLLADDKLKELLEILNKKSGIRAEEKIPLIANIMLPKLEMLDNCSKLVEKFKLNILNQFVDIYTNEYFKEKSGQLRYDHDSLLVQVTAVVNYRKGIQRMAQAPGAGDVEAPAPDQAGCTIA